MPGLGVDIFLKFSIKNLKYMFDFSPLKLLYLFKGILIDIIQLSF